MSSYDSVEYFFNTHSRRVVEANPALRDYAQDKGHLIPCDADGRTLKVDNQEDSGMDALQKQLLDKDTEIELLKEQIRLLEGGEPEKEPEPEVPQDGDPMTTHDHLVNAIGDLEDGNPDQFRSDGMPRVRFLEARTGLDVTEKQVEAAWQAYQEQ